MWVGQDHSEWWYSWATSWSWAVQENREQTWGSTQQIVFSIVCVSVHAPGSLLEVLSWPSRVMDYNWIFPSWVALGYGVLSQHYKPYLKHLQRKSFIINIIPYHRHVKVWTQIKSHFFPLTCILKYLYQPNKLILF